VAFSSIAQHGNAKATLQNPSIKIGEQTLLNLEFNFTAHDSALISWPEFDNYLTNSIEIIEKGGIDSSNIVCDSTVCPDFRKQTLVITSFEPGNLIIPALKFSIDDSSFYSQPIPLFVETVEIDTTQGIYDIYDIYEVEYPITERAADFTKQYWHWFLIAALLVVIFILYKRYKNRPKEEYVAPKIIIPAHITALALLNQLKAEKGWENENRKQYYSQLTDAVRQYLEDRFKIQALEQTTSEIIRDLKFADISNEDKVFLKQILQQADFVKFAKFKPTDEDGLVALDKSFDFVEKTKLEVVNPVTDPKDVE
jgi:hypothetical protein